MSYLDHAISLYREDQKETQKRRNKIVENINGSI